MGVVESTVVINARDNTKSALSSVQKSIEQIAHESVKLQKSFEEFDLSGLEGFTKEVFQTQNNIGNLTNLLSHFTQGSEEYNNVQKMIADEQERLNKLFEESADRQTEIAEQRLQEIQAGQEEIQVKTSLIDKLKEIGTSIVDNTQKLLGNREQTMSNSEAIKYRDGRISALKKSIEEQNVVLANAKIKYGENSVEVKKVEQNLAELNNELKENKQRLKEATINISPLQQALNKLGRNIKSLFLLQTAKRLIDTTRKAFSEAVDEMLEGGLKMEAVTEQFDYLAQRGGMDAIQLRNSLREASRGMVADTDLMKSANTAMMLGVGQNMEMMTNLMKIAQVRGAEMSETTTKAFDDIVRGIGRLSPMILDNLGIIINLKDAYSEYANKIGKSSDELTKAEKQMAVYNEILKKSQSELNARGRDNLSVADKINQLKIKAVNALDTVGGAFMRRIEPIIEGLGRCLDKGMQVADDLSFAMDSASNNIRVSVSSAIENIRDSLSSAVDNVLSTLGDMASDIYSGLSTLAKRISGFLTGVEEDGTDATWNLVTYFLFGLQKIGQAIDLVAIAFKQLWNIARTGYGNVGSRIGALNDGAKSFTDTLKDTAAKGGSILTGDWGKARDKAVRAFGTSEQETYESFSDLLDKADREFKEKTRDIMDQNDAFVNSLKKSRKSSKAGDRIDALFGGDDNTNGGGGGKSGKKGETWLDKQKKEMDEYAKETKKRHKTNKDLFTELDNISKRYLKDLKDEIKATSKEFEKAMDDVQDKIDDTTKEIEKLEKEIDKLNEDLAKLGKEENTSLAKEIIKEQDGLKKLEKQFEGITDIAKNTSRDEINNAMDGDFIGGYAVENIKKAKQYAEGLSGVYDGMSDEQIEALKEEIKYQEWYNSLNPIEQIKEDYRVKREEINKELEEKLKALDKENELKKQYEQELLDVQAKYTPIIEEQKKKYQEVTDLRLDFEEKYHNRITINGDTELAYTQQLEIRWNKVATARKNALSTGGGGGGDNYDGPKADGGTVLAGKQYLVGERGPELFVPRSNGSIVPNNEITNNNGVSINLSGITVRSDADINAITDEIIRKIKLEKTFGIA